MVRKLNYQIVKWLKILLSVILLVVTIKIFCENNNNQKELLNNIEQKIFTSSNKLRIISTNIFSETEVLKYKIFWEFIPVGDAEMGCNTEIINNKKVYHITTQSWSNKSIDLIYKVRNRTDSYVDYHGFYSLKFVKDQNEGSYKSKDYIVFDHKKNLWYSLLDNTTGYIPTFVQDVVTSLFYLRLQQLVVGKEYRIDVWVGKVVYPMIVNVIKKEKIKINEKEYECFKVEPKVDLQSFPLFRAKGRLFVWLTTDGKQIPVRLESRIFIGTVSADLVEYVHK